MILTVWLYDKKVMITGILWFSPVWDDCSADLSISLLCMLLTRVDNRVGIATFFKELAHFL